MSDYPPPSWMDEGFAEEPAEREGTGVEVIYRAFGGTSTRLSNCFFAPSAGGSPVRYWTADLLEIELNASLWGNDFEILRKYHIGKKVRYKIGAIAHDRYTGHDAFKYGETKLPFYQRSFVTPSGIFKQVVIVLDDPGRKLFDCITEVSPAMRIDPGRYARATAARGKQLVQ